MTKSIKRMKFWYVFGIQYYLDRIKTLKYPDFSTNHFPSEETIRSQMNEYKSQYAKQNNITLNLPIFTWFRNIASLNFEVMRTFLLRSEIGKEVSLASIQSISLFGSYCLTGGHDLVNILGWCDIEIGWYTA